MDISSLRERRFDSALSVTDLNNYIKGLVEGARVLRSVTVRGEISNFVYHRSGHLYFTLKDAEGQIKAIMFRSSAIKLRFMPENGMKVTLHGSVNLYTKDGTIQLYATSMQPDGVGALYLAYEQLKERLREEGLFDASHKRKLPTIPRAIGVITSPTGAAIRDILNILGRRFPYSTVYLYPSLVQGDGAEENLISGVEFFDKSRLVDIVIIGRGGGSIEDLWAFNGERLARRIYAAEIPIISAVGHETDFTICDFVSDLRAPTPSAAAELAVPDVREIYQRIDALYNRARELTLGSIERRGYALERLQRIISAKSLRDSIENKRKYVAELVGRAKNVVDTALIRGRSELAVLSGRLNTLSPLATLERGYAIIIKNGKTVKRGSDIEVGDRVSLRLLDTEATAEIKTKGGISDGKDAI